MLRLLALFLAICRQIQAVDEHSNTEQQSRKPEPSTEPVRVSAEIHLPEEDKREHKAEQQKKHRLSWATFWLTSATLITLVIYTYYTHRLWLETRRTADTINKQSEATDRPWIKVTPTIPQTFRIIGDTVSLTVVLTMTNVGRSVATNIEAPLVMYAETWGDSMFSEPIQRQKAICDRERLRPLKSDKSRSTLFPNETMNLPTGLSVSKQDLIASANSVPDRKGVDVPGLIIAGCVDYQYPASDRHHQTGFIFVLNRMGPEQSAGNAYMFKLDKMDIPLNQLLLNRYFFGGYYAD